MQIRPNADQSRKINPIILPPQISNTNVHRTEPSFLSRFRKPDKFHDEIHQDFHRLRIFLCHSSNDKPLVRELYQRLKSDNFDPWLDEEKILPGQDWKKEITKAVRQSDVVIICLSIASVNKAGYVQKEIREALEIADEQPEGTIFLIPLKLEECEAPGQLSRWQWVKYYDETGYKRLLEALNLRARGI